MDSRYLYYIVTIPLLNFSAYGSLYISEKLK